MKYALTYLFLLFVSALSYGQTIELEQLGVVQNLEEKTFTKQSIILYFTIAILLVILFFVYMLMKSLRQTKEQKELVDLAKLEIEEKNRELIDSITYAKRIQLALLKEDENETKNLLIQARRKFL